MSLITLYHNTSNSNAIKINKEGIIAGLRLKAYGKGSEAEGSGIWCSTVRGYGYGGATITFQIDESDEALWKANDTEYVIYRNILPDEITDIDLVISDIPSNSKRKNSTTTVESDIPVIIDMYGKDKILQIFRDNFNSFVSPYNVKQLEYLIRTGNKYCKGKIEMKESKILPFRHKLEEKSRNELLAKTKSQTITRYNKAEGYKGFTIVDIDTTSILTTNCFRVTCKVGDYWDTVEMEDILYWVQMQAELNKNNQINSKACINALMGAIDALNIKVDCTCADWRYRMAYQATKYGYKYGKPENRPANQTNPNDYGALCFDGNTLVATPNGFIPIKNIKIGDFVYTHLGNIKQVLNVGKRNATDVIKTHISSQDIICTSEHPFLVANDYGKNIRFEKICNINGKFTKALMCNIKTTNEINIEPYKAFLLGFYLANGNIGYRADMIDTLASGIDLSVNAIYKDIYEDLLKAYNIDYTYHGTDINNSAYFYIKSNELRDFCVEYGCFNYKDRNSKYLSNKVLNWSLDAKIALIRGFFAGDGQYGTSNSNLNMRLLNTNKSIIDMLHLLLRSMNIHSKCGKYSRKPRFVANNPTISNAKDMYFITITGTDVTKIDIELLHKVKGSKSGNYKPSSYKSTLVQYNDTYYYKGSISDIVDVEPQEVYNLIVADDESYLVTYDLIAVHNCKHLTSMLSNKKWLQQVAGTLMDFCVDRIDDINRFLRVREGEELTLPNELARTNAKKGFYSKLFKDTDSEIPEGEETNVEGEETTDTNDTKQSTPVRGSETNLIRNNKNNKGEN